MQWCIRTSGRGLLLQVRRSSLGTSCARGAVSSFVSNRSTFCANTLIFLSFLLLNESSPVSDIATPEAGAAALLPCLLSACGFEPAASLKHGKSQTCDYTLVQALLLASYATNLNVQHLRATQECSPAAEVRCSP